MIVIASLEERHLVMDGSNYLDRTLAPKMPAGMRITEVDYAAEKKAVRLIFADERRLILKAVAYEGEDYWVTFSRWTGVPYHSDEIGLFVLSTQATA